MKVQALMAVLVLFLFHFRGFRNRELRPLLAQHLGVEEQEMTQGRMSYQLRRLRLHGLIERIEGTHRYRATEKGIRVALFYSKLDQRLIRPTLSELGDERLEKHSRLRQKLDALTREIEKRIDEFRDRIAA